MLYKFNHYLLQNTMIFFCIFFVIGTYDEIINLSIIYNIIEIHNLNFDKLDLFT